MKVYTHQKLVSKIKSLPCRFCQCIDMFLVEKIQNNHSYTQTPLGYKKFKPKVRIFTAKKNPKNILIGILLSNSNILGNIRTKGPNNTTSKPN